jgi:hypothetical protein
MSPYERLAWQALRTEIYTQRLLEIPPNVEKLLKRILKDANIELNKLNFWAVVQKGENLVKRYNK